MTTWADLSNVTARMTSIKCHRTSLPNMPRPTTKPKLTRPFLPDPARQTSPAKHRTNQRRRDNPPAHAAGICRRRAAFVVRLVQHACPCLFVSVHLRRFSEIITPTNTPIKNTKDDAIGDNYLSVCQSIMVIILCLLPPLLYWNGFLLIQVATCPSAGFLLGQATLATPAPIAIVYSVPGITSLFKKIKTIAE